MEFGLSKEVYDKIKCVINKFSKYQFKLFYSRARGDYKKIRTLIFAIFGDVDEKTSEEIYIKIKEEYVKLFNELKEKLDVV